MEGEHQMRVAFVSPEPTPYRAPLLDRIAALPEVDLTVIYAAQTVASRSWHVDIGHPAVFLSGINLPGAREVLRHDYPITLGILGALVDARPDVLVVSGWSTFASQASIAWGRQRRVPYILLVESHDAGPKAGWRRQVKTTVVPPIVRGASSVLVVGSLAQESVIALGADPTRVRVFANTIDVAAWIERAHSLAATRNELRTAIGLGNEEVAVLSVARLAPEKGLDVLLRASSEAGVRPVVVGSGPGRTYLESIGRDAIFTGELPADRVAEAYVAADVFALLSAHEPWGVVVNEAAATGLPLVLSDRVGAAADLLRVGQNGLLVPYGDVSAAAEAMARLAGDPELRRSYGDRSRELAWSWGYEPSVENFVEACREAIASR
jgi:glycosyltransferase involved in cell wall biosynthesis